MESAWWITPLQIYFRQICCQLAEIRGLRKILIALERDEIERSALCRSREHAIFYQLAIWKLKIKCKNISRILLFEIVVRNSPDWSAAEPIRFNMLLCPAVYPFEWWKPQLSSSFRSWVIAEITESILVLDRQ